MSAEQSTQSTQSNRHRVVVIGAGFGGLFATKALRRAAVDVTVVERTTHHLFQPLLYQVATGILSEGEIAPAVREVLKRQENARVLLGEVREVDVQARTLLLSTLGVETVVPYDTLIVAAGAGQSYFGHDEYAEHAPGMKSVDDALELRGRIFGAFEMAELVDDPEPWLTFVVVGGGPTGVEMAGQIAELSHRTLRNDFRRIDPRRARVVLIDAVDQVLGSFGDRLSGRALRGLERLGVEVQLGAMVVGVDATGIEVRRGTETTRIEARTKVWAAGVSGAPIGQVVADATGAELDRSGRVKVRADLTVPGHPEVFVIGDLASTGLPGVAQVAIQGGRYAARVIRRRLAERDEPGVFEYYDKGSMATISRFRAVASVGKVHLSGFPAWVLWMTVHLLFLTGFKNRVTAVLHWGVSFVGRGRGQRVVTRQQVFGRRALLAYEAQTGPSAISGYEQSADVANQRVEVA